MLAFRQGALSKGGAVGAVLTGTIIFAAGLPWAVVLLAFFISSSGLGRLNGKGEQRTFWQVAANGGVGTLLAGLYVLSQQDSLWLPFVAVFASANADTWATEIGRRFGGMPRLITTLRRVPAGISGGVSPVGTAGAAAGAGFIGLVGLVVDANTAFFPVLLAGFLASLFDSLLGASVQALYACGDSLTERRTCPDGSAAVLRRGWRWINNDTVNLLAVVFGALLVYSPMI